MLIANPSMLEHRVIDGVVEGLRNFEIGHTAYKLGVHRPGLGPKPKVLKTIAGDVAHKLKGLEYLEFVQINASGRCRMH